MAWPQVLWVGHTQVRAAPPCSPAPRLPTLTAGTPCPAGSPWGPGGLLFQPDPPVCCPAARASAQWALCPGPCREGGASVEGQAALPAQTSPVRAVHTLPGHTQSLSEEISLLFSLVLPAPPPGAASFLSRPGQSSLHAQGALSRPGSLHGCCRSIARMPEAAGCGHPLGWFGGHPHWAPQPQ